VTWSVVVSSAVSKKLRKLGPAAERCVVKYLDERVLSGDPRSFGKPLTANLAGYWRYRVGDYRIICRIEDSELIVLVLEVGHRRDIYR